MATALLIFLAIAIVNANVIPEPLAQAGSPATLPDLPPGANTPIGSPAILPEPAPEANTPIGSPAALPAQGPSPNIPLGPPATNSPPKPPNTSGGSGSPPLTSFHSPFMPGPVIPGPGGFGGVGDIGQINPGGGQLNPGGLGHLGGLIPTVLDAFGKVLGAGIRDIFGK